ncbi:MAG: hypothetical protein AUI13_14050 [Gemmatimonadetes bacterium 13_2_20CM_2_69_23]|nr:MAG: hypothetical protein AUI13_14050 [Gemmatimonadetes bacterium 13_2_20CM_2_69_23]
MKRRKSRRTSQRKPQRQPRPSTPAPDAARDADPLADSGLRPLLESYCRLAGVKQAALAPDLTALSLPQAERPFFRDRASLRVAFSLDALERDPDADIAVLGSPFLSQLIGAIRARAAHLSLGLIAPTLPAPSDPIDVELTIPVRDGTAQLGATRLAVHPVGRLSARVVLRAGAGVEEAVVESDVYDLSAGVRLSDDLVAAFRDLEAGRVAPADPSVAAAAARIPARQPTELLELLLAHLRDKSAERVAARRALAEQELAAELGRLDRYFESILKEQTDPEAVGTVTALAERRRTEEIRRSQVKAVVHPLQLIEADVLIQRAEWRLESAPSRRHHATFSAQRPLGSAGAAPWSMACPQCGRPPAVLVICRQDHCACEACSHRCSVCAEDFCADHGIAQCRVDAQAACDEHVRVCPSCRLEHCTAHEGLCTEGDGHPACSACLAPCGNCGRVVCNRHAEQSHAAAPKGSRRLCAACLKYCEGGTKEPVGVDEVAQCASCGKSVCTAHQAVCAVDGQAHCAPHLRRTDKSQRLVCARHRAGCAHEPGALFAVDEVGTCPICARGACQSHRAACEHCGRRVCTADLSVESRRCATCAQLAAVSDLPHAVVAAVLAATGSGPKPSRRWRMARDRSHLVVELDLGWRQTAVVTLRRGDNVPDGVVKHSPLRLKRRK